MCGGPGIDPDGLRPCWIRGLMSSRPIRTRSREEPMKLSRRDLAAAGAFALGAASLLHSAPAQAEAADDAALNQAVEALRKATLAQDKAKLEQLLADQVS